MRCKKWTSIRLIVKIVSLSLFSIQSMRDYEIIKTNIPNIQIRSSNRDLPDPIKYTYEYRAIWKKFSEEDINRIKRKNVLTDLLFKQITIFLPLVSINIFFQNEHLFVFLALIEIIFCTNDINIMIVISSFVLANSCSDHANYIFHIYLWIVFCYLLLKNILLQTISQNSLIAIGTIANLVMFTNYFYYHKDAIILPIGFAIFSSLFVPVAVQRDYNIVVENTLSDTYNIYKTL